MPSEKKITNTFKDIFIGVVIAVIGMIVYDFFIAPDDKSEEYLGKISENSDNIEASANKNVINIEEISKSIKTLNKSYNEKENELIKVLKEGNMVDELGFKEMKEQLESLNSIKSDIVLQSREALKLGKEYAEYVSFTNKVGSHYLNSSSNFGTHVPVSVVRDHDKEKGKTGSDLGNNVDIRINNKLLINKSSGFDTIVEDINGKEVHIAYTGYRGSRYYFLASAQD